MTALGQRALISNLIDPEALDLLAREGLDPVCIPEEQLRKVVAFALGYFHDTGRTKAPTEAVLRQHYGDLLDDLEIVLGGSDESIEWAIDDLRSTYVYRETAAFNKRLATAMSEVEASERVEVVSQAASELVAMSLRMESREFAVDAREGLFDRMVAYSERASRGSAIDGLCFGLPMIDDYTLGIHPGEVAVMAAPPKTGKSYILDFVALQSWVAGRVAVIYTLENSVGMTLDRIACLACGIDSRRWEKGQCEPEEITRANAWIEQMQSSPNPLWVLQPDIGKRTAEALVLGAQLRGADDLLIDQLPWIEHPNPNNLPRNQVVADIVRTIKTMVSAGRHRMPVLIAHQINREGEKAADKAGFLSLWHLSESAEVERASDWVFGMYQSHDERAAFQMKFQTLASRREDLKHFRLRWMIGMGVISAQSEIVLDMSGA